MDLNFEWLWSLAQLRAHAQKKVCACVYVLAGMLGPVCVKLNSTERANECVNQIERSGMWNPH